MAQNISIKYLINQGKKPQMNPPSIKKTTATTLNITSSNNGNFLKGYKIYNRKKLILKVETTSTSYNFDLNTLPIGGHKIKVKTFGNHFKDSEFSNEVEYGKLKIESVLNNITSSNTNTDISYGETYETTFSVSEGYYLPTYINLLTMDEEPIKYNYDSLTGNLKINVVKGNIKIVASGSIYPALPSPVISIASDSDIISWNAIENANGYNVYANEKRIYQTSTTYADLNSLIMSYDKNLYNITVTAIGENYQESPRSNTIEYSKNIEIYGVSGFEKSNPSLIRTYDNVGKSYYINSSEGIITTDFDDIFPAEYVGDNLEILHFNNSALIWETEDGIQYTGTVFRKFRKFYKRLHFEDGIKMEGYSNVLNNFKTGYDIAFARRCPEGFYCPAYFTNVDGSEMDFFLISVYKLTSAREAVQNKSRYKTNANFLDSYSVNYANETQNNKIMKFYFVWKAQALLRDLFMIVFGTRRVADVYQFISKTISTTNGICNSTRVNSQFGVSTDYGSTLFFGIEDFFMHKSHQYLDGSTFVADMRYNPDFKKYVNFGCDPRISVLELQNNFPSVMITSGTWTGLLQPDSNNLDFESPKGMGSNKKFYSAYNDYSGTDTENYVLLNNRNWSKSEEEFSCLYCFGNIVSSSSKTTTYICGQPGLPLESED